MAYRRRLALAFIALPLALTILWAIGIGTSRPDTTFWALRNVAVRYSGILSIGFLSGAVILAARPVQLESLLGGLDKYYRLHKWFGIAGASLGVLHWLIEILPRSFVRWGWIAAPVRRPRPQGPEASGFDIFREFHEPAVSIAEPALYIMLALVLIALWKRFPYRFFFQTHRLLAIVYLLLMFHGAILMGPTYWRAPIGPVLGLLMVAASIAALVSLFHRIGKSRRATGTIREVIEHPQNNVVEVTIGLATAWPGHRAGQFAFVDFGDGESPHPFTISSAWRHDGRLSFSIKALGDYTRALPERIFAGQSVTIEGPYGRFEPTGSGRQLWIAGGIGIAPFLAGLESLDSEERSASVDLVYSTRTRNAMLTQRLTALAERTGTRLHILVTPPDDLLTIDRLQELVPDWRAAEIWFCGPAGFKDAMRDGMVARGLPPGRFHEELFSMR